MRKLNFLFIILWIFLGPTCPDIFSQKYKDVASEHLLLRIPKERDSLGRRVITELERFYRFLKGAINAELPDKIIFLVDWDLQESSTNYEGSSILVGMQQPASNPSSLLLNETKREMARLGLFQLSRGALRPDYEFMYEGMIEILVHEFDHTSRSLESAWAISQFLDEMGLLGLESQRTWSDFSSNRRCMRSAAPGITFLLTLRDLEGRQSPAKFFEALRRANLSRSLKDAFKEPAPELEKIWINKVRQYRAPEEIIISEEEIPELIETISVPDPVKPGDTLGLNLRFMDNGSVLLPDGVFLRDVRTGKLFQAQADIDPASESILCKIPVEADCAPGEYGYQITAIDESGNLRRWMGGYKVAAIQE